MSQTNGSTATAVPAGGEQEGPDVDLRTLIDAGPTLARLAAVAWWRTTTWAVEASARAYVEVLRAAVSGESPAEVLAETGAELRDYIRRLLETTEQRQNGRPDGPPEEQVSAREAAKTNGAPEHALRLRERGAELLRLSADVTYEEEAHPAYGRILGDMAPDEARILRLLALEGPQPSVDVRAYRPFYIGSDLVAPGLSMIGAQAGARYLDRVHAYLNNLYRMGLIWFSRESLEDPLRYQVLEAQPEVVGALKKAGRGRTVRRSIHLTPFGEDFCQVCLPLERSEIAAANGEPPRPDEVPAPAADVEAEPEAPVE